MKPKHIDIKIGTHWLENPKNKRMAAKTKAMDYPDELFMKLPPNPIYADFQKIFPDGIPPYAYVRYLQWSYLGKSEKSGRNNQEVNSALGKKLTNMDYIYSSYEKILRASGKLSPKEMNIPFARMKAVVEKDRKNMIVNMNKLSTLIQFYEKKIQTGEISVNDQPECKKLRYWQNLYKKYEDKFNEIIENTQNTEELNAFDKEVEFLVTTFQKLLDVKLPSPCEEIYKELELQVKKLRTIRKHKNPSKTQCKEVNELLKNIDNLKSSLQREIDTELKK